VAPGTSAPARFRGGSDAADLLAICLETVGDPAARHDGPIVAPGVLCTSAVLLRWTHAHGQCVDAERMAAIPAVECDIHGDAGHGEALLQERGQTRTSTKNSNAFRTWRTNKPAAPRLGRAFARRTDLKPVIVAERPGL